MRDDAYGLALLPDSMTRLGLEGANAIEANLGYLIGLFPLFDAAARASAIGSLGYLELTETGSAGEGFLVEYANRIDRLTVTVTGTDLSALRWQGTGWEAAEETETAWTLCCATEGVWSTAEVASLLAELTFSAEAELDAEVTLTAACADELTFDRVGPVALRFRAGSTWALVEQLALTWQAAEEQNFTWSGLESLGK